MLLGLVVIPFQRCVDVVLGSLGVEGEVHLLAVFHHLPDADVAVQRVCWRRDVDIAVRVPGVVEGERWQVAVHLEVVGMVVHVGRQRQGLAQLQVDAEEASQPVGLAHQQPQTEVVVGLFPGGRQSGQGREPRTYQVDEALG